MTKYKIKLYSKEKKSLTDFFKKIKKLQNFQIILTARRKKIKKNRITILKSPHVNKKAQEQFQFTIYGGILVYLTWDKKKGTIFLKKIKNNLFPGVRVKVEYARPTYNKRFAARTNFFHPLRVTRSKTFLSDIKLQKNKQLFNKSQILQKTYEKKTLATLKRISNYGISIEVGKSHRFCF